MESPKFGFKTRCLFYKNSLSAIRNLILTSLKLQIIVLLKNTPFGVFFNP